MSNSLLKLQVDELSKLGQLICNRYLVLRQINNERVYLVSDTVNNDKLYALKLDSKELIYTEDFNLKREYLIHSTFCSDNIVTLGEAIEDESYFGFLMTFVGGGDLSSQFHHNKSFSIETTIKVLKAISNAISHIHDCGFIHTDIKPENILINGIGEIRLTDFGLARNLKNEKELIDEQTKGTLRYLCPHYLTTGKITKQMDIYSLGIMAYDMLTGVVPFENNDIMVTLQKRVYENPLPVIELRPDCPKNLSDIIDRCIQISVNDRYTNTSELLLDLDKITLDNTIRRRNTTRIRLFKSLPNKRRRGDTLELEDNKAA